MVLHPGVLHSGAPVDASFKERHTLVVRFFGDDATYRSLPVPNNSDTPAAQYLDNYHVLDSVRNLKDGEPFRAPFFTQLR